MLSCKLCCAHVRSQGRARSAVTRAEEPRLCSSASTTGVCLMTAAHAFSRVRKAEGLYDPAFEHDSCGVAFVATLTGVASHDIISKGLEALRNLDHRGAVGADPKTGDGAGMLLQIPDGFLRGEVDFVLPPQGEYAVGNAFLP